MQGTWLEDPFECILQWQVLLSRMLRECCAVIVRWEMPASSFPKNAKVGIVWRMFNSSSCFQMFGGSMGKSVVPELCFNEGRFPIFSTCVADFKISDAGSPHPLFSDLNHH